MKKVTKKLQKIINSISTIGNSTIPNDDGKIYYSKTDGSYLGRVGMENDLNYLLKNGITEQIQNANRNGGASSIGFNPLGQKWFGWSHRALFGFGIGSECKKGDAHYSAGNKEDFAEGCLKWYGDTDMDETHKIDATIKEFTENEVLGVLVEYTYDNKTPNELSRGKRHKVFEPYPDKFGKGEWKAKTLEDAKIMAIDFANAVS